ncbi:hypothetical protein G4G28_14030 [Massilia sp. Dwa41.01b]|uniref:GTPase n=1 Tax=unclassified Massilia TaxID=2609279 RepID=UPI0015FFB071|nr:MULTISPECIES: GTPase [unclassified Massilia]QNA89306.1 hypothetical protein G4G28_14030 [Massilia sp. Dwa41.01b]QNB00208.1 hypothetical protein G4G31_17610 [Massilia sp. Se16.2.3]
MIAACGLMNAGKSYLLNMLTMHLEQEFFRTADIRETAENAHFESDRYTYLDTPGLDANALDDEEAWSGLKQADVVLFVHQPQGELEAVEADFLRTLAAARGSDAGASILVVLTKADKARPDDLDAIEARIRRQCADELGFEAQVWRVSGKRYRTGLLEGEPALVAASGMDALIAQISTVAATVQAIRARKALAEARALLEEVAQAEQRTALRRQGLRNEVVTAFAAFNGEAGRLRAFLDDAATRYTHI